MTDNFENLTMLASCSSHDVGLSLTRSSTDSEKSSSGDASVTTTDPHEEDISFSIKEAVSLLEYEFDQINQKQMKKKSHKAIISHQIEDISKKLRTHFKDREHFASQKLEIITQMVNKIDYFKKFFNAVGQKYGQVNQKKFRYPEFIQTIHLEQILNSELDTNTINSHVWSCNLKTFQWHMSTIVFNKSDDYTYDQLIKMSMNKEERQKVVETALFLNTIIAEKAQHNNMIRLSPAQKERIKICKKSINKRLTTAYENLMIRLYGEEEKKKRKQNKSDNSSNTMKKKRTDDSGDDSDSQDNISSDDNEENNRMKNRTKNENEENEKGNKNMNSKRRKNKNSYGIVSIKGVTKDELKKFKHFANVRANPSQIDVLQVSIWYTFNNKFYCAIFIKTYDTFILSRLSKRK